MIAIISDIHGNFPALQAVLSEIDALGCEEIISLGDVAGYYCMVNECIDMLRDRNILNLMGNHDMYLLSGKGCPRSNSANVCLSYQKRVITAENLRWLRQSPMVYSLNNSYMVHGGLINPLDEYLYHVTEKYFAHRTERFFFSGHTHIQMIVRFLEKVYCNPGSVGQPRDGDCRAAFAVLDNDIITLKRVQYDIDEIACRMREAQFDEYFYKNLYNGLPIGG